MRFRLSNSADVRYEFTSERNEFADKLIDAVLMAWYSPGGRHSFVDRTDGCCWEHYSMFYLEVASNGQWKRAVINEIGKRQWIGIPGFQKKHGEEPSTCSHVDYIREKAETWWKVCEFLVQHEGQVQNS